jgi:hypothetical protein
VTTTQRQHIALEVTVTLAGGATQTHYFATEGFRSGPADAPAGTYFAELVESVGEYRRELFGGARVAGAVKASRGSITLINAGGVLDNFAAAGAGGLVVARIGTPGAQYPAEYETLFRSYIDTVAADFQSVRLTLRDRVEQLDAPIVTAIFQASGGLEGTVGAGAKKQLVFGTPGLAPPILIDPLRQIYYVQANATDINTVTGVAEFGQMFEGGYPIARGAHYTLAAELLADDGPDPGTCRMWSGYAGDLDVNGITYGSVAAGASLHQGARSTSDSARRPVFELRFGASGYLQNSSSEAPREWRFSDLCNRAGMGDVLPETMAPVVGSVRDFDLRRAPDRCGPDVRADHGRPRCGAVGHLRIRRAGQILLCPASRRRGGRRRTGIRADAGQRQRVCAHSGAGHGAPRLAGERARWACAPVPHGRRRVI